MKTLNTTNACKKKKLSLPITKYSASFQKKAKTQPRSKKSKIHTQLTILPCTYYQHLRQVYVWVRLQLLLEFHRILPLSKRLYCAVVVWPTSATFQKWSVSLMVLIMPA